MQVNRVVHRAPPGSDKFDVAQSPLRRDDGVNIAYVNHNQLAPISVF